ncbi:MAG: hypothetical protein U0457_19595 [Candidatus Sericytochromatia bacterium]
MRFTSFIAYGLGFLFIYASMFIAEGPHLNLWNFWDLSSAITILAGLSASLINFKFSEIFNAIFDSITSKNNEKVQERLDLDLVVIKTMSSYVMAASLITFFLALILILGNAEDTKRLGVMIAVSILILMYGLFFKYIIFLPMTIALEKKKAMVLTGV